MTNDDKVKFLGEMRVLGELYDRKLSEVLLEVYWTDLRVLSYQEFCKAVSRHRSDPKSGQFFPKPADILRHAGVGSRQDAGLLAWSVVEKAIERVGTYASVVFEDGCIGAAVDDMGGWVRLCQTEDRDWPFVKQEFAKRYEGYLNRGLTMKPRRLIGLHEMRNKAAGVKDPRFESGVAPAMLVKSNHAITEQKQIPQEVER